MAVMIAGIELPAARAVRAAEKRHIVHHHIPGFEGDILQDVGRGPSVFLIEGVLHGENAQADAEALRARFRNGTPVELVATLATALEVQDVLIRSIELSEVGGWPALIHARITVAEYIEPPKTQSLASPSLSADASSWGAALDTEIASEAMARRIAADPAKAGAVLDEAGAQSPAMRSAVLGKSGGLLAKDPAKLSTLLGSGGAPTDLLSSVGGALSGDLGGITKIFSAVSPAQLGGLVGHLAKGDIASALSGASDILGGTRVGQILKTVSADPKLMKGVTEILRGNPQGLATLARGAVGNPAVLSSVLSAAPEVLDSIGMGDLASSMGQSLTELTGVDVTGVFNAIGNLDPAKVGQLLSELSQAGSLAEVAGILASGAGDFLEDLVGINPFKAGRALLGSADFLRDIRRVITSGRALIETVSRFDPVGDLRDILKEIS
jgi:DNA circularisation protein N-terminus